MAVFAVQNDFIFVEPDNPEVTEGGIILTEGAREENLKANREGIVKAVGPGKLVDEPQVGMRVNPVTHDPEMAVEWLRKPIAPKVGDRILYQGFQAEPLQITAGGVTLAVDAIRPEHVYCIIREA